MVVHDPKRDGSPPPTVPPDQGGIYTPTTPDRRTPPAGRRGPDTDQGNASTTRRLMQRSDVEGTLRPLQSSPFIYRSGPVASAVGSSARPVTDTTPVPFGAHSRRTAASTEMVTDLLNPAAPRTRRPSPKSTGSKSSPGGRLGVEKPVADGLGCRARPCR